MNAKNKLGNRVTGSRANFRDLESEERVRERVRAAIKASGGNQLIAAKSGVPLSTIGSYLGGKSEIRASAMAAIADACGVSMDWIFGRGDGAETNGALSRHGDEDLVEIARYPMPASAGSGLHFFGDIPPKIWRIPREILRGYVVNYNALASTDVRGDSMEPTLKDGEPVIFDLNANSVDREGVYVVSIVDELFIKRVRRDVEADGRIALTLMSDNTEYPGINVSPDAQVHLKVHGRVVWPNTARRR